MTIHDFRAARREPKKKAKKFTVSATAQLESNPTTDDKGRLSCRARVMIRGVSGWPMRIYLPKDHDNSRLRRDDTIMIYGEFVVCEGFNIVVWAWYRDVQA